jgi:hypothetical protein
LFVCFFGLKTNHLATLVQQCWLSDNYLQQLATAIQCLETKKMFSSNSAHRDQDVLRQPVLQDKVENKLSSHVFFTASAE